MFVEKKIKKKSILDEYLFLNNYLELRLFSF